MINASLPAHLSDALVVGVDDSEPAREALRFATGLARDLGRPLVALSVWNFVITPGPERTSDEPPSEAAWQAEAERRFSALLAEHPVEGVDLRPLVLHGNPTPTLLGVSRLASHLVVGSRGRGGITGMLLGSTTDTLVRHASCPVTVVRVATSEGSADR